MALYFESLFPRNITLESFDAIIFEFDDGTASRADQVVMMGVFVLIFEAGEAILKPTFLDEASFGQKL